MVGARRLLAPKQFVLCESRGRGVVQGTLVVTELMGKEPRLSSWCESLPGCHKASS